MTRITVELTNRCNLRCRHCYEERHAATGDLPLEIVEKVLREGKPCGIEHFSFTGGEPTIHRQFSAIVRRVCEAGYTFSFVSNGATFPSVYPLLRQCRSWLKGVTFSLDGASEEAHDRLRGRGSYRQVMRAASICVFREIPFTFNTVLTAENRDEVAEMVTTAARLGSGGVCFGHLISTPETASRGLELSPQQRREVEAEIWQLQQNASLAVGMAPGYYSETPFFPCAPLEMREFNLNFQGNLTLCCQLSGHPGASEAAVIANLHQVSLADAFARFGQRVTRYLEDKREKVRRGEFGELDHFPCRYCVGYLEEWSRQDHLIQLAWAGR